MRDEVAGTEIREQMACQVQVFPSSKEESSEEGRIKPYLETILISTVLCSSPLLSSFFLLSSFLSHSLSLSLFFFNNTCSMQKFPGKDQIYTTAVTTQDP